MPVVQVDQQLLLRLMYLTSHSNAAWQGASLAGQRAWMTPPLNGWSGNPLDVKGLNAAYDRSSLNQLYEQARVSPDGAVGDSASAKLQIAYTAVEERAFRTRHSTRIRAVAHAAGRRRQQGTAGGVFLGSVLPYVQAPIEAAGPPS